MVEVEDGDTHDRRGHRRRPRFAWQKLPFALVLKNGWTAIGDYQIDGTIIVVIRAHRIRGGGTARQTNLAGYRSKRSVSVVAPHGVSAEYRTADLPAKRIANIQIQIAIMVVINEGQTCTRPGILQPRRFGHVLERAVLFVVQQYDPVAGTDSHVRRPIVVVVACRATNPMQASIDSCSSCHILELAVAHVVIETQTSA